MAAIGERPAGLTVSAGTAADAAAETDRSAHTKAAPACARRRIGVFTRLMWDVTLPVALEIPILAGPRANHLGVASAAGLPPRVSGIPSPGGGGGGWG